MVARSSQSRGPGLNKSDGHLLEYFRQTFSAGGGGSTFVPPDPAGMTATGGVISDYTSGTDVYRAHVFTDTGTFTVTDVGNLVPNGLADYLVVAGGGAGSPQTSGSLYSASGGGGAGGLRTSLPGIMPATSSQIPFSVGGHSIVIGAGGGGGQPSGNGNPGNDSSLAYNGGTITSNAGGGGGETQQSGLAGGSGGGQGGSNHASTRTGGAANPNSDPTRQGYPGTNLATNDNDGSGGGGGGAGAAGQPYVSPTRSGLTGGAGVQVAIAGLVTGPTAITGVGAKNPANNQYQYFAGGGGGGGYDGSPTGVGGVGGGGRGETPPAPAPAEGSGQQSTGGGGGGARGNGPSNGSGSGGSGIVIVRYKILQIAATAKATGGSISFFNGKAIHAFTSAGDFNNTSGSNLSCDVVMVAGGGSGGHNEGGGGGAGGYIFQPGRTVGTGPHGIVIGAGGVIKATDGVPGNNTTFDGLTARGGGAGGNWQGGAGDPGGSGGGGASGNGGSGPAAQPGAGGYGSGNVGGTGGGNGGSAPYAAGGGGGAGGAGGNASVSANGHGGLGKQIPAVFHDPVSGVGAPGPTATNVSGGTSGKFWVSGGGGGGSTSQTGGKGGGTGGPYAGGGDGTGNSPQPSTDKINSRGSQNTGGGGGSHGAGVNNSLSPTIGQGGSGIVLVAYPT